MLLRRKLYRNGNTLKCIDKNTIVDTSIFRKPGILEEQQGDNA